MFDLGTLSSGMTEYPRSQKDKEEGILNYLPGTWVAKCRFPVAYQSLPCLISPAPGASRPTQGSFVLDTYRKVVYGPREIGCWPGVRRGTIPFDYVSDAVPGLNSRN